MFTLKILPTFGSILSLVSLISLAPSVLASPEEDFNVITFDWDSVTPSKHLVYHRCYQGFECARLEVPLDWTNSSNPNHLILAIARLPATVPVSDKSFGGTILVNPGGPSGSGVDVLRWVGLSLQQTVDSDKHFEMLSWDPRGTRFTSPSTSCFSENTKRELWSLKNSAIGLLNSSPAAFDVKWAASDAFGQACANSSVGVYPDGSNVRQFVSTALVARDMLAIIDSVDKHLTKKLSGSNGISPVQDLLFETNDSKKHLPLLNYWGFSYGSYLGNTFASMFPSRVGRMILDGNVDAPDYAATGWATNLQDSNETLSMFYEYCYEAGPKCALYHHSLSGPAEMSSKVDSLLAKLKTDPIPAVHSGSADLVTYGDVAQLIHDSLYHPIKLWPRLAVVLSDLLQGNVTSITPFLPGIDFTPKNNTTESRASEPLVTVPVEDYRNASEPFPPGYPHMQEASAMILCGDGDPITSRTKDDFKHYLSQLTSQSSIVGPIWAEITLKCVHQPKSLRPADRNRFVGPFSSKLSSYDSRSSPLLFIGNIADNVTPLRNAYAMAAQHEGARVLVQETPGHCSVGYPEECTIGVIKDFFARGVLPEEGMLCKSKTRPW